MAITTKSVSFSLLNADYDDLGKFALADGLTRNALAKQLSLDYLVKKRSAPPPAKFVDGTTGVDSGPGSQSAPWKTVAYATSQIKPGDTVIVQAGIYRVSGVTFGPAGTAVRPTTFKAAPCARVIFTGPNDEPPAINLADWTVLDGLWFGGLRDKGGADAITPGGAGSTPGQHRQFRKCTVFGYRSGIAQGTSEYYFYQGCRLVGTGEGTLHHGIYLSGADNAGSGQSNHSIVDRCILVGGEGYGIHGWHEFKNAIVTRNFAGAHWFGLAMDGLDHMIRDNMWWKETGGAGNGAWGPWLHGNRIIYTGNVSGPGGQLLASDGPNNTLANNQTIGDTLPQADAAIAALKASFAAPVAALFADTTIEANFAVLDACIPPSSLPTTEDGLWAAFHALGLKDYDRNGLLVSL